MRGPTRAVVVGNYQLGIGGDLITAADGHTMDSNETWQRLMARKRGGEMLELTIYRGSRTEKIKVKLGEAPQQL
jgi:S1-C subfamily serine protease